MLWLVATSLSLEPAAEVLLLLRDLHHKHRVLMQAARPSLRLSLRYCSALVTYIPMFTVKSWLIAWHDTAAFWIMLLLCWSAILTCKVHVVCVGLHIKLTYILHCQSHTLGNQAD